ncbi:MAG: hypothetical protein Q7R39_12890, partial [Dehalococcoidia bacterium]|nr:hypothetical protein [Dehalococcoidia bacterium]
MTEAAAVLTEQSNIHPGPTSAEVVRDIFAVCFPKAASALDITYGQGGFWKWDWIGRRLSLAASDRYTQPAQEDLDCALLWMGDHDILGPAYSIPAPPGEGWKWDVVAFDPPHSAIGPDNFGKPFEGWSDRYGASRINEGAPQKYADIAKLLVRGVEVACSYARQGAIVKTKNVVESGKTYRSIYLVESVAHACGWHIEDEVIFVGRGPKQPSGRRIL